MAPAPRPVASLRFLLGDQLGRDVTCLEDADPARDVVLMVEAADEATYARHHKKKLVLVLAAMRAFADELRAEGWRVEYLRLDDEAPVASLSEGLARAVERMRPARIVATEAGEWRVLAAQRAWAEAFDIPVELRADDRFICSKAEFAAWAEGRNQLRMEFFYRDMRRRTGLLMDGDKPVGGRWNFDAENRKPVKGDLFMPRPPRFAPDAVVRDVMDLVARRFPDAFGELEGFGFAVRRADAEAAADYFFDTALAKFGDFQDAMLAGESFLYHAVLSPYINLGLLDPLDLCRRAEAAFRQGRAPLNAVEGFIRQILGWREFVRGIYWLEGPDYVRRNDLGADQPLPWFYWTGETDMACLRQVIGQTRREAYAHHIQRLMVTGNFALILGVDPHAVHEWYLGVYADAFEWVEAPNTIGMSQFADGGRLGSKPYASSGAYINRMSDYCGGCRFDVKARVGPNACPFNYLYWDFLARRRERFARNPRMTQMYATYDRFDDAMRDAIRAEAEGLRRRLADAGG